MSEKSNTASGETLQTRDRPAPQPSANLRGVGPPTANRWVRGGGSKSTEEKGKEGEEAVESNEADQWNQRVWSGKGPPPSSFEEDWQDRSTWDEPQEEKGTEAVEKREDQWWQTGAKETWKSENQHSWEGKGKPTGGKVTWVQGQGKQSKGKEKAWAKGKAREQ